MKRRLREIPPNRQVAADKRFDHLLIFVLRLGLRSQSIGSEPTA